ncbi:MAG TPA: UPF0182 family protein [Candidatus Binataceae bacterium]|nr:UPF0182 family protein [Candidatus Binataceae bacterium]
MRPRIILVGLAATIIVLLIVLGLADQLLVDFLWFGVLGYRSVFLTQLGAQITIFAAVWFVAFVAICTSGFIALGLSQERERLHIVRRSEEMTEVNLPELIRALGDRIPWRLLVIAASILLGLFAASGEASSWDTYLKGFYAASFGRTDPAFGKDLSFYIFTLPLLEDWRDLFMLILFLTAAVTGLVYWTRGALDFRDSPPRISSGAAAHFSVLLALFFVQRAMNYWVARPELLLHSNGVVYGLRYVDHVLWQPGLWLLVVLSLVAAAISLANLGQRGLKLPVFAAVVLFAPAILLNLLQPVIEKLYVKPDELRVEKPYLERNIALTRLAYHLDSVDVRQFNGKGTLTQASLEQDAPTVNNIRLWDPRPLLATYRQLQEIRLYYDFQDVDIDRYWIDGKYTEVMLSPREINISLLPDNAQTWVNRHLKFTHGSGLTMSPVNAKDSEGLPVFYIKNIPPESDVGFKVSQPAIYYGQEPDSYAIVKAATPEFDYPMGADNVYSYYKGTGGVPVSGLLRRLLFSYFYRDINLLMTSNIVDGSRIMIRRNISDRVARLAPFLGQDRDPYLVLHDGRLVWILDCYTTSDHFPYSQRNSEGINYIRNSVKVVVDAYDGATDFYVADPTDPIIRTWQRIFPAMFKPMSAMPEDLRQHIRYPEDYFLIQADIYRTYHMTDPAVFYNREDQWGFPRENYAEETVPMQPYYVIMRLPGETHDEYILMLPMVPESRGTVRDNMISWLAARCDGSDYGHLFEFAFSKDRLFYGPYQIQARINQNPDISQQYSLWNQMGSKVILGNLLVFPIENALLYVEPLYIRAQNGQLPELQRVIAAYSDRIVMGSDLGSTLNALFTAAPVEIPPPTVSRAPSAAEQTVAQAMAAGVAKPPPAGKGDLTGASMHYSRALAALKTGDWAQFGNEMQQLGTELNQPAEAAHH